MAAPVRNIFDTPSYNVTLWRTHVTIVAMDTQRYVLFVLLSRILLSTMYKNTLIKNYVAGNNKTCLGVHVKCKIFLSDLNLIWIVWTENTQYQISRKSVQWESQYLHYCFYITRRFRVIEKNDYKLRNVCLSIRPHGTSRPPLGGFLWNLIFECF
jgi:hypothetical protein